MNSNITRLMRGGSTVALVAAASLIATTAHAQEANVEEVVVTGTSLRGVAPVGANLVSVGREAIESTAAVNVQQILKNVTSITAMGGSGIGQTAGNSYYAPTIHNLGSSASNSTLTLIDGHRMPLGGTNHALPDPSMLPPIAIERVEVLAEGASSTYGSDAVAGVVNFITRKGYEGFEVTGQTGFGKHYRTYTAGALWGTRWETGSVMAAYGFSRAGPLRNGRSGRDFLHPNHIDEGGTNFQSFNCSPATIQPAGSSLIYLSPTSTTAVANNNANQPCDTTIYGDRLGRETRNNAMVKIQQEVGDRLTLSGDFVYSDRETYSRVARGGIQATVFSTGAQANPFYTNPPGVTAASQTIRWQADELLGPGAYSNFGAESWYTSLNAEYRLNDNFRLTALAMIGQDKTTEVTRGTLCTSCATLALNGVTASNGSLTTPSIPGTNIIITQLPLTAANALDVWNTGAANRTSEAVRARLVDNMSAQRGENVIKQFRAGVDGSLFTLPGGEVRVAAGGELLSYTLDTAVERPNNTGPSSQGSQSQFFPTERDVKSLYGEILIPLISPENELFIRSAEINISGRYDKYSDFGETTNPKIAASVELVEGLRFRGNWAKSFVAPSLRSLGDPDADGLYNGSQVTAFTENAQVPVASFPSVVGLPGCTAGMQFCPIGGTVQGIRVQTGNPNLDPQKGTTWSIGVDFAPTYLPGLRAAATLFNNKLKGGVTSAPLPAVLNSASINNLITFYPGGATQAQIAAAIGNVPIITALPTVVYYINDFRQRNVLNLDIQGLDLDASYRFNTDVGEFTVAGAMTRFLKYDQNFAGGKTFDVLNTTGFNTTFPSIKLQARGNVGWRSGGTSVELFARYVGSYRNWSGSTVIPVQIEGGVPAGGGDKVKSSLLFDVHAAYSFGEGAILGSDTEVYVDVNNLFDEDPPFYNSAAGFDAYGASPLGRVISIGFRSKF
jgi:iron complex outermembrane receptor protein